MTMKNTRSYDDARFWQRWAWALLVGFVACLCIIASENWRVGWKIKQARADYDTKIETMQGIIYASAATRCPTSVVVLRWGGRVEK